MALRLRISLFVSIGLVLLSAARASAADAPAASRPNILFIAIDDLRDWVH
jgi:hypothetical protein